MNCTLEERDTIAFDIAWHPEGNFIACVGADGVLTVYSFDPTDFSYNKNFEDKRTRVIRRVEWSPQGDKLLTVGFDSKGVIYSFDLSAEPPLQLIGTLNGHDSEIKSGHWSPSGDHIVTCSRDKTIIVWTVEDFDIADIHAEHTADVKDVIFNPDGNLILSVSFDGTAKLWDPFQEFGSLQTFSDFGNNTIWTASFNSEGTSFLCGGENGKVVLYEKDGDIFKRTTELQCQPENDSIYSIHFIEGEWIVAGASRKIYFISDDCSEIVQIIDIPQLGDINSVKVHPIDIDIIAHCNDDGSVNVIKLIE